jgi:hypothetical protein
MAIFRAGVAPRNNSINTRSAAGVVSKAKVRTPEGYPKKAIQGSKRLECVAGGSRCFLGLRVPHLSESGIGTSFN